jgi:glycosyltransferase involved in cell wall biosynthesis
VLVQNPDDAGTLASTGTVRPERIVTIPGSGVDIDRFSPAQEPPGKPRVTLVSRMLWSKGVGDFVEAVEILRGRGVDFDAVLVGDPDSENPQAIPVETLRSWDNRGIVDWTGHAADVADWWARSHVAVLPSHREGLPKTLLEAAACGRPIVTTDVPGCREVVEHGRNGLLVPASNAAALADAIEALVTDERRRLEMGRISRGIAVNRFSESVVIAKVLDLYRSMLEVGER